MYHHTKDKIKSMVRLGNNEVLKTLTKTLTFVDTDAVGSTIALHERCSGELKMKCHLPQL